MSMWEDARVGLKMWRAYFEWVENHWLKYTLKGKRKKKERVNGQFRK